MLERAPVRLPAALGEGLLGRFCWIGGCVGCWFGVLLIFCLFEMLSVLLRCFNKQLVFVVFVGVVLVLCL